METRNDYLSFIHYLLPMKQSIYLLLLLSIAHSHTSLAYSTSFLPPMPMPTQYSNLELYQKALQTWENVSKKVVACSVDIQLPSMPMPTQYNDLGAYQRAFDRWQTVANAGKDSKECAEGGSVVRVSPMPMPTQYGNLEFYRKALDTWEKVYTNAMTCRPNVQLPPMPMPTQYNNLLLYQKALDIWEKVGSCQGGS
jgi:hypothetical protein